MVMEHANNHSEHLDGREEGSKGERKEEGGKEGRKEARKEERKEKIKEEKEKTDSLVVQGLNFSHGPGLPLSLVDVNMRLPRGSLALLVGANGAGKSTLLRLLAGKRLGPSGTILINGLDPFREHVPGVTYLGTEWATNPVVRGDIEVSHLLASVGADAFPERRDTLLRILDVDLNWRMNRVSDGERRRVQLTMGLMKEWDFLLLDEVTVDLDVLARADLLRFLREETQSRNCTIVYATHIFDGLADWPTHLIHMALGAVIDVGSPSHFFESLPFAQGIARGEAEGEVAATRHGNSILLELCLSWLEGDRQERGRRGEEKRTQWADISEEVLRGFSDQQRFTSYFRQTRQS